MTENGDPYENALAERMNGILKGEFNLYESKLGFEATALLIQSSITTYNNERPHSSCNLLTPQQAHQLQGPLKKRWKEYPKKYYYATSPLGDNADSKKDDPLSAYSLKEAGTAPITEQDPASFLRRQPSKSYL